MDDERQGPAGRVIFWVERIAAVMLGMIESFGTVFVPDYPGIFFFIALAAVLLIRPQGLMGKEQVA